MMNIDIIKTTNDTGAVFFKYQTHKLSSVNNVTIPFVITSEGLVEFKMTEETLKDLVEIIQCEVT
jgi:hypothetical protein